jgi:uncharacterized protein YkwD
VKRAIAIVAALVAVAAVAPASADVQLAVDGTLDSSVLTKINQVRADAGLQPLRPSRALAEAAAAHSREMALTGYFAHESQDGSPFWKRLQRFYPAKGFHRWLVGENLVWGSPDISPDDVLQSWLNSPEHRANLLKPAWREVGLAALHVPDAPGTYGDGETTIVTADFGARIR